MCPGRAVIYCPIIHSDVVYHIYDQMKVLKNKLAAPVSQVTELQAFYPESTKEQLNT